MFVYTTLVVIYNYPSEKNALFLRVTYSLCFTLVCWNFSSV